MANEKENLVASLRLAKTTPVFFAFAAKGEDSKLLLSKKVISHSEAAKVKSECGSGSLLYAGQCQEVDGTLIFEVPKEAPANVAVLLKKTIKKDADLTVNHLIVRVNPALQVSDTEPATPATPATPIQEDAVALFAQRLKAIAPALHQADERGSPLAKAAHQQIATANQHFVAKQFAQANASLDQAENLIQQALSQPASVGPAVGDSAATRFATRLKALAPILQKLEASGLEAAQQAKHHITEGNKLYLAKQFEPANAALDQAESIIKQALSASTSSTSKLSVMKLGKARIEWISVRAKAIADIQRLRDALDAEFKDDEEQRPQLNAALKKLDAMVAELDENLANQLDAVLNASDEEQRQSLTKTAKTTMARFTRFVEEDEIMVELDGNELLPDLLVTAPLREKLQEIAAALG